MSSESYHEPLDLLSEDTRNMHRGIVSLIEELEAVDWYTQRAEACSDAELKAVLLHHRNEEIEHAIMNLEWLRRNSSQFDEKMRIYLFTEGSIVGVEARAEAAERAGEAPTGAASSEPADAEQRKATAPGPRRALNGSLGIGSLKG
ncbi:Hypothetical protein A7982_12965 [Minicystis rosea]|nr:Hypothetical protein A7982_12965 [Minicystis rosea]